MKENAMKLVNDMDMGRPDYPIMIGMKDNMQMVKGMEW